MNLDFKVKKRDGLLVNFNVEKISQAIARAFKAVGEGSKEEAERLSLLVKDSLPEEKIVDIENIQDLVEKILMENSWLKTAKAYIIYRQKKMKDRQRNLFKKRFNIKPYEYPELYEYVGAIRHSYWIHTEFNYISDVQDFKVNVSEIERQAIKNTMLAIAQIEVAVKAFWGDIYKKMPKPEIAAVGFTFAESEVRHMDAYSHLLEILGLNQDFESINKLPALMDRVNYLENIIEGSKKSREQDYALALILFSLFIEHVSLFSQFLIMMSFNKEKNLFKGISNAVEATSKEEQIHGLFGIELINLIKKENPNWFNDDFKEKVMTACNEAYQAEEKVLNWILEKGELSFLSKETILEFIKNRLNNSLQSIGLDKLFPVNEKELEKTNWFDEEVVGTKHGDFFVKRSINYNKRSQSITEDDLF